jgi:glycine cleavage system H protein
MDVPEHQRYTSDHEWARLEEGKVRVGITDFAQDALGDVVFVELPAVGAAVDQGGPLGEIESTKSVSQIYSPVAGTVAGVNPALSDEPERVNTDPYGEGWLCILDPSDPSDLDALLDAAAYRSLTES